MHWPPARYERVLVWTLLALPALPILWPVVVDTVGWRAAIRPSGDIAAKLLVLALALSPLKALLPSAAAIGWLVRRRRWIGVAAFGYATLHMVVFVLSIGRLDWILQGLAWASMWTGWLAFLLLVPLAATSHDAAALRLGRGWKRLHRLAYPAALLTLAHWLLLSAGPWQALAHALPLVLLYALAAWRRGFSYGSGNAM